MENLGRRKRKEVHVNNKKTERVVSGSHQTKGQAKRIKEEKYRFSRGKESPTTNDPRFIVDV